MEPGFVPALRATRRTLPLLTASGQTEQAARETAIALLANATPEEPVDLETLRRARRELDAVDLSQLESDALGRIYEGLLGANRRRQGSYFTPRALAETLAELALRPLFDRIEARDQLLELRLLDPAMGGGGILLALLDALCGEWIARSPAADEHDLPALRRRLSACLVGVDLDPGAVRTARLSLALHTGQRATKARLVHGDALGQVDLPRGSFDAVVGNPPYQRELDGRAVLNAVRRSRLGHHARSKGDLWFFFTHLALELLRPGGQHAFLVPAYWLKATGAGPRHLREELRAHACWRALVDLERLTVFRAPGGGAVAGRHMVFAVERRGALDPPARVAVYRAGRSASLAAVRRAVHEAAPVEGVTRREVAPSCVYGGQGKVLLGLGLSRSERDLLRRLRGGTLPAGWRVSEGITANPERLSERRIARVLSEAGVDLRARGASPGDPVFRVPHPFPRTANLSPRERKHLLPFLPHEAVTRLRAQPPRDAEWLIHTTHKNATRPEAIPNLIAHLATSREVMELRRETRRGSRAWYHLHWPRSPELLDGPRVLVPRMVRWPSAALAHERFATGESVFTIRPADPTHSALVCALLNALPFALGILLTTKSRGKGIDIARSALTGCPWPTPATLSAPPPSLQRALAASERLSGVELGPSTRAFEGPWWGHTDPRVVEAGGELDEAVCGLLELPYGRLRDLAERRLTH